ncbi:MAG: tail fiber protein [Ignavibacteriae bacterium]|nr:tail fiber protein [Ignavibacteriota bacterium]
MKKIVFIFLFIVAGSVAFSQTQSLPKMKFTSLLMNPPVKIANPPLDSVSYQTIDSTLTTITFTVNYSDGAMEEIWNSGAQAAGDVNFLNGKFSYNIGPVHGDISRPMKIVVDADGYIFERAWHSPASNDFRVPLGTVQAYMGAGSYLTYLEKSGWYLCDGRAIASLDSLTASEKNALAALLASGGNPDNTSLPDMRGYFLRGADNSSGNDPDEGSRSGTGAKLGSVQGDRLQSHSHTINADAAAGAGTSVATSAATTTTVTTNATGGNETRPKNIYVNWIIKAK